nr:glycosyltransferase [Campylobacter lanienae]
MYKYYFENAYFQNKFKIFINVARLSIEKDQEKLIYAFKEVNKQYPNTKLIILGDGPLREKLENLIKRLKLKKSIFLLGRISNPYPYLKKADCFVMSSNHEGQGLAMIEALILKKPVISTNFSCAYDVLDNGRYGLIVDNNTNSLIEAMKKFLSQGFKFDTFKYKEYNEKAILDFYNVI